MTVRVRVQDRGLKAFKKALAEADARGVAVGIHQDAGVHGPSGLSMAELGAIHEFGAGSIPARSFLRGWADVRANEMLNEMAPVIEKDLIGGKAIQALNKVGLRAVGEIQQRISAGIPPALNPATVARKGSSVPLIDTGALRQSITHKVVPR